MIRKVSIKDAEEICGIYNYYILNTIVTFEDGALSKREMEKRIQQITSNYPWIVYVEDKRILGYAYATMWKTRSSYKNTVEVTFYVNHDFTGKGIGSILCKGLLVKLKKKGYHSVIGGIALPNEASVALHEKFGFKKVAHFHEVGHKFEKWIDVGYWELTISKK